MMDYAKLDQLVAGYFRATDKAAYLADVWGDLSSTDGRALLQAISDQERERALAKGVGGGSC